MTDDWIKKGKDCSTFPSTPSPLNINPLYPTTACPNTSTFKFLSTQNYLYRLHCKTDKESS